MHKIIYLLPIILLSSCFRFDPTESAVIKRLENEREALIKKLDDALEHVKDLEERLAANGMSDEVQQNLKVTMEHIKILGSEIRNKEAEIENLQNEVNLKDRLEENLRKVAQNRDQLKEQLKENENILIQERQIKDNINNLFLQTQLELGNTKEAVEKAGEKLDRKKEKLKNLRQKNEDLKDNSDRLAEEKQEVQKRLQESNIQNQQFTDYIEKLNEVVEKLKEELQQNFLEFNSEKLHLERLIKEGESKSEQAEQELIRVEQVHLEELQILRNELNKKEEQLEKKILELESEINIMESKLEESEQKFDFEREDYINQIDNLEKELLEAKENSKNTIEFENERKELERKARQIQSKLEEKEKLLQNAYDDYDSVVSKAKELSRENDKLTVDLGQITIEHKQQQSEYKKLIKRATDLQEIVNKKGEDLNLIKELLSKSQKELEKLRELESDKFEKAQGEISKDESISSSIESRNLVEEFYGKDFDSQAFRKAVSKLSLSEKQFLINELSDPKKYTGQIATDMIAIVLESLKDRLIAAPLFRGTYFTKGQGIYTTYNKPYIMGLFKGMASYNNLDKDTLISLISDEHIREIAQYDFNIKQEIIKYASRNPKLNGSAIKKSTIFSLVMGDYPNTDLKVIAGMAINCNGEYQDEIINFPELEKNLQKVFRSILNVEDVKTLRQSRRENGGYDPYRSGTFLKHMNNDVRQARDAIEKVIGKFLKDLYDSFGDKHSEAQKFIKFILETYYLNKDENLGFLQDYVGEYRNSQARFFKSMWDFIVDGQLFDFAKGNEIDGLKIDHSYKKSYWRLLFKAIQNF